MKVYALPVFLVLSSAIAFGQGRVSIATAEANVRSAPNAKAAVIAKVKQDETLQTMEVRGSWYKVKVGERTGWIHGNSLQPLMQVPLLDLKNTPYGDPNSRWNTGPGTGTGGGGMGSGKGTGQGTGNAPAADKSASIRILPGSAPLRILSKPAGTYTDAARSNQVQGTVKLRVTFLASGEIGPVIPITSLPHGLTEQAIAAAQRIRFEPERIKGVPKTVVKVVEYTFMIY
jgi:TonB family protein